MEEKNKPTAKQSNSNRDERGRFLPGHSQGFQLGQSGNPNGRPRNEHSITHLMRQMKDEVPTEIDGKPYMGEKTRVELVAEKVWDGAMAGDARFTKELLDRMEGAVPHTLAASVVQEDQLQSATKLLEKLNANRER